MLKINLPVSQTLPGSDQLNHLERTAGDDYSLSGVAELELKKCS